MTEETMQEARKAFLVDTLKKLLGQDSPSGFTDNVVTAAEGIARELGFAMRFFRFRRGAIFLLRS